jgi:NADP-dependent 3-hydroxy acid dehydrogenase YdfG
MSLAGKVAVVTGGGSGVGKATARMLLDAGAKVVIAGRDAAKLQAVADEFAAGDALLNLPTDVTSPAECQTLIDAAVNRFGRLDVLVNNAGMNLKNRTVRELTPADWDRMVRANLDGAFYCTKAALPTFLAQKDGLVVNVVSVAGLRANPLGGAAYVAAKHGMGALGTVLANEERESGVRVCNLCPGEIDTPILADRPTPVTDQHRAMILKPEDVAAVILFVVGLPPRVSIPEVVMKPTFQAYW